MRYVLCVLAAKTFHSFSFTAVDLWSSPYGMQPNQIDT